LSDITKVKSLEANQGFVSLELEIVSKSEIRQFASHKGSGRVCNLAAKDSTGEIKVTLWNEQCDQVSEGNNILIENGWCSEYKGEKQVSTGRGGTLTVKEA